MLLALPNFTLFLQLARSISRAAKRTAQLQPNHQSRRFMSDDHDEHHGRYRPAGWEAARDARLYSYVPFI